jgi:phosphoesterase RecJ-like protein
MQRALESLEYFEDRRVAVITLTPNGLPPEAAVLFGEDDFINLPRSLAGVEVVVQFKLVEGEWKVGFRGKGPVNVQAIALALGGGGHYSASGCELRGSEAEVKARVLSQVRAGLPEL